MIEFVGRDSTSSDNSGKSYATTFKECCMNSDLRNLIIIVLSLVLVLVGVAGIMQHRSYKKHAEICPDGCNLKTNPRMLFGLSVIIGIIGLIYSLVIVYMFHEC